MYINKLAINNDYIFCLNRRGVFRAKLTEITNVETDERRINPITIFPNPTSNTINIQFENSFFTDISQIRVYSGLGNEIELAKPIINENNIQLDVSSLPQGVYYISFFNKGKFERARFVKIMDN